MTPRLTDPEQLKELLGIPFTPEQTACITAPPAPQVIVAGAGSGKTTVMAARVVWLVGTGQVAPEQVLGLTFTNKAAGELSERVRKALVAAGVTDPEPVAADPDQAPGEPQISTYHAFAGRLLKEHGLRIGLEPGARLLADATRFQLAARVLRGSPGPFPALTRSFGDLVADLLALDGELAEHLVPAERLRAHDRELLAALEGARLTNADLRKVPETARARLELLELVGGYRAEKRKRDLLDFGDQIALSAELARSRPEVGRILREQFAVILLDEYQDTSVAQRILLSGLFGGGTGHAVTAVGDPCQAIYGWRGASVANLDDFPQHFPFADGSPARRFALSENRRSGGRLLDLANGLAAELRERHEGVEALRPAPGAERDGVVRCALLPTHAEELEWLADSLAHLVRTGTRPGDIAVLCRTAADFAQIQGALVRRELPVEVVGLSGLLHLPEIADLVAVCEVLQDPAANASLVRLLIGPRWRIGPRDLALLGRRARTLVPYGSAGGDPERRLAEAVEGTDPAETVSLADALDTFLATDAPDDGLPFSAEARVRFARLAAELRDLRRSLADPLMDVLHRVLAVTGLEVELSASPHALAARRRETLSHFMDIAAGFAAVDGETTLLAFLGFLRTAAQYEKGLDSSLPGGEDTVKVLTAHKSKGLEWDVVAVPGLVERTFPSEQSRDSWTAQAKVLPHALRGDADTLPDVAAWDAKGMAAFKAAVKEHQRIEELRLGYVTFTRPRSLLLGSGHWWGPSQKKPRGPSAFLEALRAHCEAGHGEIEAWAAPPEEDAENPALQEDETDRSWPLPLDPDSLARRRAAADAVLAHLERLESGAAGAAAGAGAPVLPDGARASAAEPEPAYDPDWPPPPEDEDDAAYAGEPAQYEDEDEHFAAPDTWETLPTARPEADGGDASAPPSAGSGHLAAPDAWDALPAAHSETTAGPGEVADHRAWDAVPAVRPEAATGSEEGGDACAPGSGPGEVADHRAWDAVPAVRPGAATGSEEGGDACAPGSGPGAVADHRAWDALPAARPEGAAGAPGGGPVLPGPRCAPGGPGAVRDDHAPARSGPAGGLPHPAPEPDGLPASALVPEEARLAASWDRDLDALAGELRRARARERDVPLPASLSAWQLVRLAADPDGFARELARPMPRPPQPAARRGTRFHAWIESRFEPLPLPLPLLGPDELPGGAEDGFGPEIADEQDLAELKEAFERTPYARRVPHRIEVPVQLTLAGRVVRGRIDAVYRDRGPGGDTYEIVDWKTSRAHDADPLQLAIYRVAWAEQHGIPLSSVTAAFVYVRDGETVRPDGLPDRAGLERLLLGERP
ncbi:ATP-dependent helicase [Streptomyces rectiverticillatus]|uniref:UvrD-helicase domain-containing protein n=1 Tax=Streptomyces rectiverticillatus TaxID=173860 RepID=UPI0015C3C260|nr:UvrD-helicase domain-containing protein [Streptomyces rectiverticillatus]QLE73842.1 ATP-dependent helicase [Streptomyces rectiverticillatus]